MTVKETGSAVNAARAFAALSDSDREREVARVTSVLQKLHSKGLSLVREAFELLAKSLLEIGRFDDYHELSENNKIHVIDGMLDRIPIETYFLINDLKKDADFTIFKEERDTSFQEFDTELFHRFDQAFRNFGSDDFRKLLHQYFQNFGGWHEYDSAIDQTTIYSGSADRYMVLSSFALKGAYGEKKVMLLIDKMIRDNYPIRSIDFIKIIKSGVDYQEYPLSWIVSIV